MTASASPDTPRFRIRSTPDDFVVVEEPLYAPTGEGGHTYLDIEKRGRTTEQVVRELAQRLAIAPMDVGYAGRKDRHARTRQWFSVPAVEPERAMALVLDGARVLAAERHPHKLKTGHLRANHFELALRCDVPFAHASLAERAEVLVRRGIPNRFGEQRFGRDGDNAERARALFAGRLPRGDRRAARFLLSALQAEVFNTVLERRLAAYDAVELGDLARVETSGGLFWVDDLAREQPRAAAFEISATGPIFGTKVRAPRGAIAELEAEILAQHDIPSDLRSVLPRGLHAEGTRRPLRVRPRDLAIAPLEDGRGFRLRCALPPGAYVTVLLDALVGPVDDVGRDSASADASAATELCSPGRD